MWVSLTFHIPMHDVCTVHSIMIVIILSRDRGCVIKRRMRVCIGTG